MLLDKCCVVFGSADERRLVSTPPRLRGERPQRGRWRSAQRPAAGLAPHVQPRGAVLQPGEEGAQRPPDHRERRRANGSSIQRIRILSFCSVSRLAQGKRGSAPAPGPSRGVASGARITRRAGGAAEVHPVLCLDSRAPCCALEKGAMVPRPVGVPVSRSGAARQETTGRSGQGKCMHARPEPVSRLETMRRGKRGGTATAFSCRIAEGGRPFRCRLIPVGWLAGSGRRGGSVPWPDTGTLAGRGSSAGDDDDGRVRVPGEERAERGHEAWEKRRAEQ
jgi:hypothetical protein